MKILNFVCLKILSHNFFHALKKILFQTNFKITAKHNLSLINFVCLNNSIFFQVKDTEIT